MNSTNSIDSQQTEVSRIRAAYARRNQAVPEDRYSFFREENLLVHAELQKGILRLLRRFRHTELNQEKVLDVGCGRGFWLRQLIQWGATPNNLFGIDLLEERIQVGKEFCPLGVTLQWGDASNLEFEDGTFDLILQFTVFTSILDLGMKKKVATEMSRVLKPRGAVLWYDFHVNNPHNPDVRAVRKNEIRQLFPGCQIHLRRITLVPPIGRFVARYSPLLYTLLSRTRILSTHYLGLIEKK